MVDTHIEREHQSSKSKPKVLRKSSNNNNNTTIQNESITSHQQRKVDINNNNDNNPNVSTYENHAYVVIGPRNVVKIYYMLKMLERIGNQRPIHKITRSPNRYPKFKLKFGIEKYKGSVLIFDDMLGARTCSQKDDFLKTGNHENLDVFYISQSYFSLPRQSIRDNRDRLILFKQL